MKYKLPRLEINNELNNFSFTAVKRRRLNIPRISRKNLKEMAEVARQIKKIGLPKNLVLRKLKGKLGYGIFLHPKADPIETGTLIAPYAGVAFIAPQNYGDGSDYIFSLIPGLKLTKKEQAIWDPKAKFRPNRVYSLDLDAEKKGNFTRFINHSSNHPNVEAHFVRIPQNSLGLKPAPFEMLYIAKEVIWPGEQLLVCYDGDDDSYWGAVGIKPFPLNARTFRLSASLKVIP